MTADFYKKALDCSSDGILITDEQGNVIYVNEQYEEVTGLQASDLLGRNLAKLLEEGIISRAISLEVIETGQRVSTIHSYITGKSALSTANPIYDNENKLRGVVNNTRNLNTLIALREELKQSQEQTKHFSAEVVHLRQVLSKTKSFIYRSKQMQRIIDLSQRIALYDSTVLIEGESGTGKEVMARLIHYSSPRREEPFIKVNCAAIPSELFESELFGYEKGAFTGASATGKIGMFELANKGTLLMDEIGELPSKIVGLYPQKGVLQIGSDADIVVFNPDFEGVITHADSYEGTDYAAYEGFPRKGIAEKVFLRGKLMAENGKLVAEKGKGQYIKPKPYAYVYQVR